MYIYKRISLALAFALALLVVTSPFASAQSIVFSPQPDTPTALDLAPAGEPVNIGGILANKAPNFSAGVYGDGQAWGTKGTTTLPAPNENNQQSYDKIYVFTNGAEGQLPVAEAAPGNPNYNGGRWWAQMATWTADAPSPAPVLTSYDELMEYAGQGLITIVDAANYFQCPLLPVK
jgi:hypothetical protein